MNRTNNFTHCLIILLPFTIFSQHILIKDKITDFPLMGVNIYSNHYGTTTDSSGKCNLSKFHTDDEIIISHIGYEVMKIKKSRISSIIQLNRSSIPISGVSVISFKSKKERLKFNKLERDGIRVYPYAVLVGKLLIEYSTVMDSINELSYFKKRKEKKKIFTFIEKELINKYGRKVKRLSKNQGRILIRLVDRETKYTSHQIIKDFRGYFIAGFWQITARIFGHNLKSEYNPDRGEDKLIEHIIKNKINESMGF